MVRRTDRQVVTGRSSICALDAGICLVCVCVCVVLGSRDVQEHLLLLQLCCGQAVLRGRKPSLGSQAEHLNT